MALFRGKCPVKGVGVSEKPTLCRLDPTTKGPGTRGKRPKCPRTQRQLGAAVVWRSQRASHLRIDGLMDAELPIPAARLATFVRQHAHDVRNRLNSLELEAGLLEEIVTDEEGAASIKRMRKQMRALAEQMRTLSTLFQDPEPMAGTISARELFLIWREQHSALSSSLEVRWVDEIGDEKVCVDVGLMATVLSELLRNAVTFSASSVVTATARREKREVVFELLEPKLEPVDPSGWGQALASTLWGGYGLGLWAVGRLAQANHASFLQQYVPEKRALVSRLGMPLA